MLTKMTKLTLAGALVVGSASLALAGGNSGEYSGGYAVTGNNAWSAYALAPSAKRTLQAPLPTVAHHDDDNYGGQANK